MSITLGCLLLVACGLGGDDPRDPRAALQPFNELIGAWRGSGEVGLSRTQPWGETIVWSWRFKDQDAWLECTVTGGKIYGGGELRSLADGRYQLTLHPVEKDRPAHVFIGKLAANGRSLIVEREDEEKKETHRLTLQFVGEIRYVLRSERRPQGRTQFVRDFQLAAQRAGESLAKQPENTKPVCIVSGGLGTMTVSYKGVTYYVCCTGCRDEFNANPEKYIKEWEEKRKKP